MKQNWLRIFLLILSGKCEQKKVADNFIKDFNKIRKTISENPYFKIWFEDFRAVPLKKYPFLIFFLVDEKENIILIARVFHTSQNPEKYP